MAMLERIKTINQALLLLLFFVLPLSTSAITVLALLVLAGWLAEGGLADKWREVRCNPVCLALALYLGSFLVGILWSDEPSAGVKMLTDQWKLALLPVFLTLVRPERRWWYLAASIAGIAVLMLPVYLVSLGILPLPADNRWGLFDLMTKQIIYTPMLAFASYLLYHQVLWGDLPSRRRLSVLLLALLTTVAVFITQGRAGQLVFFLLMGLLVFQWYRGRLLTAAAWTLVGISLVFAAAYTYSPLFKQRVDAISQEIREMDNKPDTSVAIRLHFWQNSWRIIRESPWYGVGTGSFKTVYAQYNSRLSPHIWATDNPHNQYLFVTVQMGLLGLCSLVGMFLVQMAVAQTRTDGWQRIRLAFPLFFLCIMFTDSYLNSYGSGFLFALYSAVLYKGTTLKRTGRAEETATAGGQPSGRVGHGA